MAVDIAFDPAAYGAWFDSPLGRRVWVDEERALFGVLQPKAGWHVLDAGCGDGRLLLSLARHGVRAVGVDASAAMLRAARDRACAAGLPVQLARADVRALPFADESFDAVAAVTVLCFVADSLAALREVARTVRRGGRVAIGELGRWSSWAARRRSQGRRHGGPWSVARFWSARGLRRLLRAAGLVSRRVRGAVFYPRSAAAARAFAPLDAGLGAITTVGAAFIALAADKPAADAAPLADAVGRGR
ncbi:MAG: class I SAM-dependent methyltransferase [Gemmatimonadetes bacterium]|nr:class I SAM-dependent methyltransferase [Gemmatimonadota bacterium]